MADTLEALQKTLELTEVKVQFKKRTAHLQKRFSFLATLVKQQTMVTLLILTVPLVLLAIGLILCSRKIAESCVKTCPRGSKTCSAGLQFAKRKLMWSSPIRVFIAAFLTIAITARPSSFFWYEEVIWVKCFASREKLVVQWAALLLIIILPLSVLLFACLTKPITLVNPTFRIKFGTLVDGIDLRKGWPAISVYTVFCVRRVMIATLTHWKFHWQ